MGYLDIYNLETTGGNILDSLTTMLPFNGFYIALIILVIIMIVLAATSWQGYKKTCDENCKDDCCKKEESKPTPAPAPASAPAPTPAPETKSTFESEPEAELFTNDLPYQLKNEIIKLKDDDDYSDVLQKMALDQDVIKQHNMYVNERNKITSTASFSPMRSDNQDIVTTVGLTKPSYVKVDESARQVPSSTPEQQSAPVQLFWR